MTISARPQQACSEIQIENTCTELLEHDGWRSLKTDPVSRKEWGKGFGEKGMADRLYIRYHDSTSNFAEDKSAAQVMWIEWKRIRTGRKKATTASPHQNDWHALERKRGALTLIAGVDFPASIDGFTEWYLESGLNRRIVR